jgi:hypothetical protein
MKRKTAFILFLLLIAALVMAGDAWRRINSISVRDYNVDEVVRPLRQQMNELRGEIQDLHKLYMKQWATLERINAELDTRSGQNQRTTETRILTEPVKDRAEKAKIASKPVHEKKKETQVAVVPVKEKKPEKTEPAKPVIEKKTAGAEVKATVAQPDNSAEKLLAEFVDSMALQQQQKDVKTESKPASFTTAEAKPAKKTSDSRKKIVFKANANGTLKPKKGLSAEVKIPRKETKPVTVAEKPEAEAAGNGNLPSFLDINSLVSTTATAAVTAENKKTKTTTTAAGKTVRKTTAAASMSRRKQNRIVEADPSLPGASPVRVKTVKKETPVTTTTSGTTVASRTGTGRRRVKAVTPEDLRPNPPKRVAKAETDVKPEAKPETIPSADTLVIDLKEQQAVARAESTIIADVEEQKAVPEVAVATEASVTPAAPKRLTSVPAQTGEPDTQLADLRPSQLYKQKRKAGEIMRVSMTDQLSPEIRRRVKRTMADVLEEYDAMTK